MGKTGCGKSSFISKLAVTDYTGAVGHNLKSETHLIHEIECRVGGRRVLLIDTPGFDDTAGEDVIVLESIAKWLHTSYNDKKFLSALIYMHDIGETRVGRSSVKSFKLFRKITGQENMKNVVLLTTKWDDLGSDQLRGAERESQLKMNSDFWKGMIADGASFMRHDGTTKSAENVAVGLLDKTLVILNMQKQMAGGSSLAKTDAGAYVNEELIRFQREAEENILQLRQEFERASRQKNTVLETQLREHYDRKIGELEENRKQQQRLLEVKLQEQENRMEAAAKKKEDDEKEQQNRDIRDELRLYELIYRQHCNVATIAIVAIFIQVVEAVTTTAIARAILFTIAAAIMPGVVVKMVANNIAHIRYARAAAEPPKNKAVILSDITIQA
ncbi:uncharacterized protein GGS22DRAFT_173853 [Annulohypoxylon maeteangense]|uniref:uncharacterized protein n=1 Tax=Annulohypoxylon maeteangense TaxID=1927788 RepID=UPI0020077823|nr:uncharacterized protein GGS22DRAFT_173853 [Annulohypoxylon maeteangense]KAI0880961.1 hypothetical protein GGS22DRAFT_173853 [Annulohypoxylon maeteangense]